MATGEPTKDQVGAVLLQTIEQIDDYFEYRCESAQDQAFVYKVLADMEQRIRNIRDKSEST